MTKKRYNFAPLGEVPSTDEHAPSDSDTTVLKALPDCAKDINSRINAYYTEDMAREITPCTDEDLETNALTMDPYNTGGIPMIKVKDTGPLLTEIQEIKTARAYFRKQGRIPSVWAAYLATGDYPPFLFEKTSFINFFHETTIILVDIYRPPWKNYYTSDVFFSQWLRALEKNEEVQNLPDFFPETLYVNNITNVLTKKELKKILDNAKSDVFSEKPHSLRNWYALKNTPHLKCVLNILNDYNRIKSLTPDSSYEIKTIQCYRKDGIYNLKMKIGRGSQYEIF